MIGRVLLRVCNALFCGVLALGLILVGSYGAYALWDNQQILEQAGNVREEMLLLKPRTTDDAQEPEPPSFEALREINPDVCGWITLEETGIDYPILQGETNLTYINTDVYGAFSLAGSIFLDSRCGRGMDGTYSLLYGHHMDGGNMFGDLDKFKQEAFFRENGSGTLMTPEQTWNLTVFATLVTGASDRRIFDPQEVFLSELLDLAQEEGLLIRQEVLGAARQREDLRVIALSTCASEFTDARTIVLAVMEPYAVQGTGGDKDG